MKSFEVKFYGGGAMREDVWYARSKGEAKRCARDEYRQTYADFKLLSVNERKY